MNRTAARALVKTTLVATGAYTVDTVDQVYQGALEHFDGRTPIAVITSRTMALDEEARALYTIRNGLYVSIYVRKPDSTDGASDAEDTLDTLVEAATIALYETRLFEVGESSSAPDGYPLREIDGVLYRVERLQLTVLEEESI